MVLLVCVIFEWSTGKIIGRYIQEKLKVCISWCLIFLGHVNVCSWEDLSFRQVSFIMKYWHV